MSAAVRINQSPINNSRVKRSPAETFEEATERGHYGYWLTQVDIADIARIEYNNFNNQRGNSEFEIIGSLAQFREQMARFDSIAKRRFNYRLTLIVNLYDIHWVSLIISSKNLIYSAFYIDSLGKNFPDSYDEILRSYGMSTIDMSLSNQQIDGHNCGLWALENAYDLNIMLDGEKIDLSLKRLGRLRTEDHFIQKRLILLAKFRADSTRYERIFQTVSSRNDAGAKQAKSEIEAVMALAETFVASFITECVKRVAAARVIAKESRLTEDAFQQELKTTALSILFGTNIAQGAARTIHTIPFLRNVGAQLYLPKNKAKITMHAFSRAPQTSFSSLLANAALDIFQSFEGQFIQITDRAGNKIAMEKLAEDAATRTINFIIKNWQNEEITSELISKAILFGQSEKYFSLKKIRLMEVGNSVQDRYGNRINTADLYDKIGLVANLASHVNKFYKRKNQGIDYGYRRLLSWEKAENGDLKSAYQEQYAPITPQWETTFQRYAQTYHYNVQYIQARKIQLIAVEIVDKINSKYPNHTPSSSSKRALLFELRSPVRNFSGRKAILRQLHTLLVSEKTTAIVPSIARLTVGMTTQSNLPNGLGGIGKTQLALRYAELYAAEYDYNVLWINAKTKDDLRNSFCRLAIRLDINLKDKYEVDKPIESIVEDVYDYFSDRKSLLILDNAEEVKTIASILPKAMLANKPSVLITSRNNHWENIAQVLRLAVFTDTEATELIKKELSINDPVQKGEISELNRLVQGLPLALQQVLAYIKNQNLITNFGINDYIELFKTKNEELRLFDFDFSRYNNDPYTKLIYTLWDITLEKIRQESAGPMATSLLEMMAYMYPDLIEADIFIKDYRANAIFPAIDLLKKYALINEGNLRVYTIHRLIQRVVVIRLEREGPIPLSKVLIRTADSLRGYPVNTEIHRHYLYFLLKTANWDRFKPRAQDGFRNIFDLLKSSNTNNLLYSLDIARHEFSKDTYLEFLGKSLFFYTKSGAPEFVATLLNYVEELNNNGIVSMQEIESMLDYGFMERHPRCMMKRFSTDPEKRQNQLIATQHILSFRNKLDKHALFNCKKETRQRRSVACLFEEEKQKTVRQRYQHLERLTHIARFTTTGILTKDMLSALLRGDFASVAINSGLLLGSTFLGKVSHEIFVAGELLSAEENALLKKQLSLEGKTALNVVLDQNIVSVGRRKLLGNSLKLAAPFVARGISLVFVYDLLKEIKGYQQGNQDLLPNIIATGVIVGVDGVGVGIEVAEVLGYISGVSAVTGPLGEAITAMVWLGAEGYQIEKRLAEIEKHIHLTKTQTFIEGMRSFFHLSSSNYIQNKANNNRLVAGAIAFLKEHTAIKRYAFSTLGYKENGINSQDFYKKNREKRRIPYNMSLRNGIMSLGLQKIHPHMQNTKTTGNSYHQWNEQCVWYIPELSVRREIYFTKKINILALDASMPNESTEGRFVCLSESKSSLASSVKSVLFMLRIEQFDKSDVYRCENSLGIEYAVNRTGDATLIALGPGDDRVVVRSNESTIIILDNGHKTYASDNGIFIVQGQVTGVLQGGKGVNILVLNDFHRESDAIFLDKRGILCSKANSNADFGQQTCHCNGLYLKNINVIYGRQKQQDILFLNKEISFVDSGGGSGDDFDTIYIGDKSNEQLSFTLRSQSIIVALPDTPVKVVNYNIPANEVGISYVQFPFSAENQQHNFFFNLDISALSAITVAANFIKFILNHSEQQFIVIMGNLDFLPKANEVTTRRTPQNAHYSLQDGTEIKVLPQGDLYAKQRCNNSLETILNDYPAIASRLNMSFSIEHSNIQNETELVLIGHNKHEILYSDPRFKNHLLGNNGDNIYVIVAGNTTTPFPLADITLYAKSDTEEIEDDFVDTLDLRPVVNVAKQLCPGISLLPHVMENENDLIVTLTVEGNCTLDNIGNIVKIKLNNTLIDNHYEKLNILVDDHLPLSIVNRKNKDWEFVPIPLVFEDKEIIILTKDDITENAEILILKNVGDYTFWHYNNTDLILSNVASNTIAPSEFCSLFFSHFYNNAVMRRKVLSSNLTFLDQAIALQDYESAIMNATEFVFANDTGPSHSRTARSIAQDVQQSSVIRTKGWWLSGSALIAGITGIAFYLCRLLRRPTEMIVEQQPLRQAGIQAALAMINLPFLQAEASTPKPSLSEAKATTQWQKKPVKQSFFSCNKSNRIAEQLRDTSQATSIGSTKFSITNETLLFFQWFGGICNNSFAKRTIKANRISCSEELPNAIDLLGQQVNAAINNMELRFR